MDSAELTDETAVWVGEHLGEIEARFHPDRAAITASELGELKRKRAKELFG